MSNGVNVRDSQVQLIPRRLIDAHPMNAHTHTDRQVSAVQASLEEFGFVGQLLVRPKGRRFECLDGHCRLDEFGADDDVPCLVVKMTDSEARRFLATFDRVTELAGWDRAKYRELVAGLQFTTTDLDALVRETIARFNPIHPSEPEQVLDGPDGERPADRRATEWGTESGQLWEMISGRRAHRILCGDARDPEAVQRLMEGQRARLLHTDPPFGVAYDNADRPLCATRRKKPKVQNDDLPEADFERFLAELFRAIDGALTPNAAWYVWHGALLQGPTQVALREHGLNVHRQIIWRKAHFNIGRGQFHWQHENALMAWRKRPPDYGAGNAERNQGTVWDIDGISGQGRGELDHETPKPVELFRVPILKHLKPGELCLDPCAGTGPALLAAEELGRVCYAMDNDPRCVATCLDRMAAAGCQCSLVKKPKRRRRK